MNVWDVCLTHDAMYGGIHRSVCNFAAALDGRILSFDDGAAERTGRGEEPPVVRVACRPRPFNRACHWVTPGMAAEAAAHVAGADLLVVHSLFRGHAPWAARWCRRRARPWWSVPEGCLDPWVLRRNRLAKRLWLACHAGGFFGGAVTIFATARERQKAAPIVGKERTEVIHWPVPLPDVGGREDARGSFRAAHGIPDAARALLVAGRLHPVKRPLETIDAFVRGAPRDAHLVIVGTEEGITIADLEARVPADSRDRVHVLGPLAGTHLDAAFAGSDGFISLSFKENFGFSFAEAMAHGLPVIVSPGHDLAHDLAAQAHGFACGWLLPDDTATAAEAAIREWGETPAVRLAAMGGAGRAWVDGELTFARFRDRLHALAAC
mgnify:CR=1 FL=1